MQDLNEERRQTQKKGLTKFRSYTHSKCNKPEC